MAAVFRMKTSTPCIFFLFQDGATTIGASSDAEAESYTPDISECIPCYKLVP